MYLLLDGLRKEKAEILQCLEGERVIVAEDSNPPR